MDDSNDFCAELNRRTKSIHDKSDKATRIKLAVALTDVTIYTQVLGDFYYVFKTIEELISENAHSVNISALWLPKLCRRKKIEQDLAYYLGLGWKDITKPSPAAQQYVSHLEEICGENPDILIAYVAVIPNPLWLMAPLFIIPVPYFFAALLAGGYILRKIIRRTLGLSTDDGLMIFHFSEGSRIELKNHIKKCNK
uniref:heme oxygenase-like n=1 Tax=Styela clava TaxID=7725 RepID=UPI00193A49CA|nr:heme oxygenase-like [Styela clava]